MTWEVVFARLAAAVVVVGVGVVVDVDGAGFKAGFGGGVVGVLS